MFGNKEPNIIKPNIVIISIFFRHMLLPRAESSPELSSVGGTLLHRELRGLE